MSARRSTLVLRGLACLLGTLTLLIGVPLLLVISVGWPLPTVLPSVDALENAAQSGIDDQVIIKILAVIAWVAWAQVALSLIVEAVALLRGRQAIRLPVMPAVQVAAAHLVAGVLLLISTAQPARALPEPPPLPVMAEASARATAPADLSVEDHDDFSEGLVGGGGSSAGAPAAEQPTVIVQRHDSYWSIAERTLGDGLRWREIHDLNDGRTLADGTTITAGDDTIHSGWVLLLPGDATVEPVATGASAPAAAEAGDNTTTVVEPGDNLWSISEDRLDDDLGRPATDPEVDPYWREVIKANQGHYVRPGDPDLIQPGQVLVLPPTGFETPPHPAEEPAEFDQPAPRPPRSDPEVPGDEAEPSTTTVPASESESPAPPVAEAERGDPADNEDSHDPAVPLAVAVGGLSSVALAVGLKRLVDRRRRRFANEHPGEIPGRTPTEQRDLHQAVVAQADEDRLDDLQGILGRLAASLAGAESERRPRMIRHSDHSLEVLLDRPDPHPPAGWISTDEGTVWTLVEPPASEEPYDGPLSPSPLMVTIGQPEDDAQLYLDLEADGVISLTGASDVAANLARSIVTELTLSPLADTIRVIAVGDVVGREADVLDHLTITDSWDGLTDDLIAWATESHAALAENDWANAFVARGHEPDHDALVPIAVVADRPPPEELATRLRSVQPSAVAVVVVGEFEHALATIRCEDEALNFDVIDLACTPQELEADELDAIASVLVAADSPDEEELIEQLRAEFEASASSNGNGHGAVDDIRDAPAEPPDYDVLVRLLGDITVEGGERLKPKATAVVAYLAINRSVTTERLEEACWFGSEGASHTKRLHDTMTENRAALGSQHFPANRSGSYVVGPGVRTDLELFEWHVQRAADLPPDQAVQQYEAALHLLTGKPFSYPNAARASFGWVDFEHHATTWELRVAGVAQACAALHLDAGEPRAAITMLRHVVQVIPLNSALVEALMRAHLADDDRAGAESVYREHAAALEQATLGDPEDSIEQLRLDLQSR